MMMNRFTPTITATMTTKGQVTVPKPIRDLLQLEEGSLVEFREVNGIIEMSKKESQPELTIPLNIVNMFLQSNKTIGIIGLTASGKTHFTKEVVHFSGAKHVALNEPVNEISSLLHDCDISIFSMEGCISNKCDMIIINEANHGSLNPIAVNGVPIVINTHAGINNSAESFANRTGYMPDLLVAMENKRVKEIRLIQEDDGKYQESILFAS